MYIFVIGNTYGTVEGSSCLGCASQQEEFYNCADIEIIESQNNEVIENTFLNNQTNQTSLNGSNRKNLNLLICFFEIFIIFSICFNIKN